MEDFRVEGEVPRSRANDKARSPLLQHVLQLRYVLNEYEAACNEFPLLEPGILVLAQRYTTRINTYTVLSNVNFRCHAFVATMLEYYR